MIGVVVDVANDANDLADNADVCLFRILLALAVEAETMDRTDNWRGWLSIKMETCLVGVSVRWRSPWHRLGMTRADLADR